MRAERACDLERARELTRALEARGRREPLRWNPSAGNLEIDALRWFDYVHGHDMPETTLVPVTSEVAQ